jgi:hypothetical protein
VILEHKIKQPADVVFDHLTDMKKFVSIHPIIYKMDDLANGNYKVYEKLKLFGIPTTFTYNAAVVGDPKAKTVKIKAVVMKMTKIEMNFTITAEGEHSHIHETVTFRSPLPIKGLMQNIFKAQHKQLFLNIEGVK